MRGVPAVETDVRHLDDVLQLARLLLHLGSQEQAGQGDGVPVEALVGVEHVEAIRVHDRRVDAKLGSESEVVKRSG